MKKIYPKAKKNHVYLKNLLKIMVLTLLPLSALAQYGGGTGAQNDPFLIKTPKHLEELATYVNDEAGNFHYYKLYNDIDLSAYGANYNNGKGWIPIGKTDFLTGKVFRGSFDGNGKIISNLYINQTDYPEEGTSSIGLFGTVDFNNSNAEIKNLGVTNVNINASIYHTAGAVVGGVSNNSFTSCKISNCYSTGTICSPGAGGVIGTLCNITLSNCHSSCTISSEIDDGCVGGVVGDAYYCNITNCYSTGSVSGYSGNVGGVVGKIQSGNISNCYSTGSLTFNAMIDGGGYIGGITGSTSGASAYSSISNCYSTGAISASATPTGITTMHVGGIVGKSICKISNCYSTSSISVQGGTQLFIGGIGGLLFEDVSNCAALNPSISGNGTYTFYGRIGYYSGKGGLTNNIGFNMMLNPDGNTQWSNVGANQADGEDITREEILADGTLGGRFTEENGWTIEDGKLPGIGDIVELPEHLQPTLTPPVITTTTLPAGKTATPYSVQLEATGTAPISWSLATGSLPNGLTLSTAGVISGTPTTTGTSSFIVKAENSAGNDSKALSIVIEVVGIDELRITNYELQVYPNPTNGEIVVSSEYRVVSVEIFDIYGKKLSHYSLLNTHYSIDISHLQAGIYFVNMATEQGIITKKIIKQ